jgi:hypothetical protein
MTFIWCINKHTKTMKLMASLETELFAFQIFSHGQNDELIKKYHISWVDRE